MERLQKMAINDKKYSDYDFRSMRYKIDPKKLITDSYPEFLKYEIFENMDKIIEGKGWKEKKNSLFSFIIYCFDDGTPFFEGNTNTERKTLAAEKAGISKNTLELFIAGKVEPANEMTATFFRHTNNLGIELLFSELEYFHTINNRLRDPENADSLNIFKAGFEIYDRVVELKKKLFNNDAITENVIFDAYKPQPSYGKIEKMVANVK